MADDELPDGLGDEFDESDFHFAAQHGDVPRVRQLLADGRSPNAVDEISKTPLHYAAESGHIATSLTSVRWLSPHSWSTAAPTHGFLAGCSSRPFIRPNADRLGDS